MRCAAKTTSASRGLKDFSPLMALAISVGSGGHRIPFSPKNSWCSGSHLMDSELDARLGSGRSLPISSILSSSSMMALGETISGSIRRCRQAKMRPSTLCISAVFGRMSKIAMKSRSPSCGEPYAFLFMIVLVQAIFSLTKLSLMYSRSLVRVPPSRAISCAKFGTFSNTLISGL